MAESFPYLAMDSAGKRTILCDHPVKIFDNTTKRKAKMAVMTKQEIESHTKKLVARLLGQDAAMDDETAEKLLGFLKSRLSAEDHEQVCNMLAGDGEAQDTESLLLPGTARPAGMDSSFRPRPRGHGASYSSADAASFAKMFPDAARIRLA
jgi:hypothetical protein